MMLPIIATPKYEMIVPSTGEAITYRPYLVREEKVLLIALESQDDTAIENAVESVLKACIESKIDIKSLTTFDIEFMFVTLRSKSVGEGIKVGIKCESCEESNEIKIELEKVIVTNLEDEVDKHIKLSDDMSIDVRWPTNKDRLSNKQRETQTDAIINMLAKCIATVYHGEDIHNMKDVTHKEATSFIESLSTDNFQSIMAVMDKAPVLHYDLEFKCKACGHENVRELNGLVDFFT